MAGEDYYVLDEEARIAFVLYQADDGVLYVIRQQRRLAEVVLNTIFEPDSPSQPWQFPELPTTIKPRFIWVESEGLTSGKRLKKRIVCSSQNNQYFVGNDPDAAPGQYPPGWFDGISDLHGLLWAVKGRIAERRR